MRGPVGYALSEFEMIIPPGSGHALKDPEGEGSGKFRVEAMRKIRDLIYAAYAQ